MRTLAMLPGGFTLEDAAAVAVGEREDLDEFEVFETLSSLVDKSLVEAEPSSDPVRYGLRESTRAYAAEKLRATRETALTEERSARLASGRSADERVASGWDAPSPKRGFAPSAFGSFDNFRGVDLQP